MRFRKERAFLSTNPTFLGGGGDLRDDERARVGSTTRKRKENGRGKRKKKCNHRDDAIRFAHHDDASRSLARCLRCADAPVLKSMMMMKMMKIGAENLDFACLLMRVGRSAIFFFFFFPLSTHKKRNQSSRTLRWCLSSSVAAFDSATR